MHHETQKPGEPAQGSGINLLHIAQVIVKRKQLIIGMTLATAVLSSAVTMFLPKSYTAVAKVLPPQNESNGLSALIGQIGGMGAGMAGGGKGDTDLYVAILNSRSLTDAVIDRLDLSTVYQVRSREELRRQVHNYVEVQAGRDGIIVIKAEDANPKRAALLANTVVDELGKASLRLNLTKAGAEKYFLERRLDITKKDLKKAEEDLKAFCEANKIVQPDGQAGAALGGMASLKATIASSEVQLSVLRRTQTDESSEVKALVAAIDKMKKDLARMAGSNGNGEGFLSLGQVPEVGLAYARKMREVRLQEAIFEQLTKQYEISKLNDSRDTSTIQVLDQAVIPEKRSKPNRTVIVSLSTLAALLTSLLLAFGLEYHQRLPEEHKKALDDLKREALSLRPGTA